MMKIRHLFAIIAPICASESMLAEPMKNFYGSSHRSAFVPYQPPREDVTPTVTSRLWTPLPPTPTKNHPKAYFDYQKNQWIRIESGERK